MNVLRPYQQSGKADIFSTWELHDIIMFVLATGGGKTVTFVEIIREFLMRGKRCMLIAHKRELIFQSHRTLFANKIRAGIIMSTEKEEFHLPCQVASIQTLIGRKNLPHFDLIVVDEGHHVTASNSYAAIFAQYPDAKILIVTATPYRLSGEGFRELAAGKETQLIINSTLASLTEDGWLVPIKYFIATIPDLSMVKLVKGDYEEESSRKAMELVPLVDSYIDHVPGQTGVVFGINVAHSKETIVPQYTQRGIPCVHLDANTNVNIRDQAFSDLRTGLVKLISNVGIITEGVDIPTLDFVQLANPTKSLSQHLQKCGRVTRALPGIVDNYSTPDLRKYAIQNSDKPFGTVLDNCGAFKDHFLPYHPHPWEMHFNGTKKAKKTVSGDVWVYIAEDGAGNIKKTKRPEEIEGWKLIEVVPEIVHKIVNIVSLKKFEDMYSLMRSKGTIKKPGYAAFENYMKYCEDHCLLVVPDIWAYLRKKLVDEPLTAYNNMKDAQLKHPGMYPNPEEMEKRAKDRLNRERVSSKFLDDKQQKYMVDNADEIARYAVAKLNN